MPTEEEYQEMYNQVGLQGQAGQASQVAQASAMQQYAMEEKQKSLADAQLEVENTLEKLYHLLKQDVYREVEPGRFDWVAVKDDKKRVLTDEGTERIMQTMNFYINKENLLSNFSEEQINNIMLTFRLALNANFFMKYNTIFRQPSFEECKDILEKRITEQAQLRKYALDLVRGQFEDEEEYEETDEEEIKRELLSEMEYKIEKEITKIREEKRKENLREWELIFEQLSQMVLATLNRAWKGEERGSLRRHTNISEVLGRLQPNPHQEAGRFKWLRG